MIWSLCLIAMVMSGLFCMLGDTGLARKFAFWAMGIAFLLPLLQAMWVPTLDALAPTGLGLLAVGASTIALRNFGEKRRRLRSSRRSTPTSLKQRLDRD